MIVLVGLLVDGLLGYNVSGHTLKHLAAAAGAFVVLRMLFSQHNRVKK